MKILREIGAMVSGLCKKAQAPGFVPSPSYFDGARGVAEDVRPWIGTEGGKAALRHGTRQVLRGAARGFADFVPDTIDSIAGVAGGVYGKATGTGYYAGKERGYAASGRLTDRLRRLARLAASPMTDKLNQMDRSDIAEMRNDPLFSDAADAVAESNRDIGGFGAVAGSIPAFGLAARGLGMAASGASRMLGAGDRASRFAAWAGRSIPSADFAPGVAEQAYYGIDNTIRNHAEKGEIDDFMSGLANGDAASERYAKGYEIAKRFGIPGWERLRKPTFTR